MNIFDDWKDEVGQGWHGILDRLATGLKELGWAGSVFQVKEKFGYLRVYLSDANMAQHGLIEAAERESMRTCEDCGKPGRPRDGSWIKTLCDEHEAKH